MLFLVDKSYLGHKFASLGHIWRLGFRFLGTYSLHPSSISFFPNSLGLSWLLDGPKDAF